jgi:hypothetical protein
MQTVSERPDEQGYNGWTNYETWSVALIIDNDQSTHEMSRQIVREAIALGEPSEFWSEEQRRKYRTADALKAWVEEEAEVVTGMLSDLRPLSYLWSQLLSAALSDVVWEEIADNYLSELDES